MIGTSFSGSTLLAFLLNDCPDVISVGEITGISSKQDPGRYPCSCGCSLSDCPFWEDVTQAMRRRGFRFGANEWGTGFLVDDRLARVIIGHHFRSAALERTRDALVLSVPKLRARLYNLACRNIALISSILEVGEKSVFVDVSKDDRRVHFLRNVTGSTPLIVHLVRDSLGFVSSNMANGGASLESSIMAWNRNSRRIERLRDGYPASRWVRVRYEDLCVDPNEQVARIASSGNFVPARIGHRYRGEHHHVLGNRMRLNNAARIELDEVWRDRLTRRQTERVLRGTARYRRVYGYPATL